MKTGLSLKPSEEYADKLRRQLDECSVEGTGCELCTNESRCTKLYDMVPVFISEDNYRRYSREFSGLKRTKQMKNVHTSMQISSIMGL